MGRNVLDNTDVRLTLHRGKFERSFARFGKMDPFVVLSPNCDTGSVCSPQLGDDKSSKTQRARAAKKNQMVSKAAIGGHLNPEWDFPFPLFHLDVSRNCLLDVYDRNSLHKNTFMGTAVLNFQGVTPGQDIRYRPSAVYKKREETGILWFSISWVRHEPKDHDVTRSLQNSVTFAEFKRALTPPPTREHLDVPGSVALSTSTTATDMTELHPPNMMPIKCAPVREESREVCARRPPNCLDGVAKYLFCS